MDNYQESVKSLIVDDNVLEAIELFYHEEEHSEIINEIIILKSNLISLNKKSRAGILSFEEENRVLNKIKFDLLNLVSKAKVREREPVEHSEKNTFSFDNAMLDSAIEKLTSEQFKVLNFINKMKKVRISGCAGSGKTLVAAEKAVRLSKSGSSVIILCHNPNLAGKIKNLVLGSNVFVISFGQLIQNLNEYESIHQFRWNKYYEPLQEELDNALKIIESKNMQFDAVIVDEAQDFREDWWYVVDALLSKGKEQILYIFHDDNQALLPYRSVYPIEEPIVDLSKNCRNGGKIYEFIKSNFHYQAPETSIEMKDLGKVKLFVYSDHTTLKSKVFSAIHWMKNKEKIDKPVVLLAGDLDINNWEFGTVHHSIPIGVGWKKELIDKFRWLGFNNEFIDQLKTVSDDVLPNSKDIAWIQDIASEEYKKIHMNHILSKIGVQIANTNNVKWMEEEGKATLDLKMEDTAVMKYFLLKFLAHHDWSGGLEKYLSLHFSEKIDDESDTIPVFETSSFKGLEADGIVIVSKGQSFSHLNELYVASSRAKKVLAIVIDRANENFNLP